MLILPIDQAKVGMKLAAPVAHPDSPEQELLKRGYVLEGNVIDRLRDLSVDLIYVDYPALDDLDRHLGPYLSPARQVIYKQIKTTIASVQNRARPGVAYGDYYSSTREMITTLLGQGQHPIYLDQMSRMGGDAVGHAAAVAHLALMLGLKLERYLIEERKRLAPSHAREVVNLGVAGMLHDLGKLKLAENVQNHSCVAMPEADEDRAAYQSHPRISYDMIHDGVEPSAASAVLHHHQRFDGTGFPDCILTDGTRQEMLANKIHVFARIIAVADLYDRLAGGKGADGAARRSNLEILHLVRTQYASWLDAVVVKTLHGLCPPYPPGSRVCLSDGTSAVVTQMEAANPYSPTVKRLIREEDWTLDDKPINLAGDSGAGLTITKINDLAVERFLPSATTASFAAA